MRVLSIKELKLVKGISYSRPHIYRLVRRREFPQPVHLGKNRIAFVEQEVDRWIQARIDDRDRWSADRRDDEDPTQPLDS